MSKTKDNTITIKTTVSLNEKSSDLELKLKLSDIQRIIDTRGSQAANNSIFEITKVFYKQISDNIKAIINEPL